MPERNDNRGRIIVRHLDADPRWAALRSATVLPRGWEWICEARIGSGPNADRGWLIRHLATQRMAMWLDVGALRSVDPTKARAALAWLAAQPALSEAS